MVQIDRKLSIYRTLEFKVKRIQDAHKIHGVLNTVNSKLKVLSAVSDMKGCYFIAYLTIF